jgi:hypothetical protein
VNKKNIIKIFHQNIQHLNSRLNALDAIVNELKPNILILSEHDMKEPEISRFNLNKYKVSGYFCRKNRAKGGVMILSEENIKWKQMSLPPFLLNNCLEEMQFEFCTSSYVMGNFKFLVIGVYRSPNSDIKIFLDRLSTLIDFYSKKFSNIIIGGDINIDVLKKNHSQKLLRDTLKSHNMKFIVNFPTRITESSQTAIDNFFIDENSTYEWKIEGVITCLSDHDGQILEITPEGYINKNKNLLKLESRKFSQENTKYFSDLLKRESWEDVYFSPVEDKYTTFKNKFDYYFNTAFPKVTITKTQKKNHWMTKELKAKQYNLIKMTKEFRKCKQYKIKNMIKEKQIEYRLELSKAKAKYLEEKICKSVNVQKTCWNIINSEVGTKNKNKNKDNITVQVSGQTVDDPVTISNLFNDYFVSMAGDINPNVRNNLQRTDCENNFKDNLLFKPKFKLRSVDEKEVENAIKLLRNKNSSGYDEIPVTLLKNVKSEISRILAHLINSSFISGLFPDQLKKAKIIPVHKKDDINNISSHRPVSVLPSISKVYEKLVQLQLSEYLEQFNLIDQIQHGFRAGRSVTTAAVSFLESIIDSIDKGHSTIGIFMDLSKAFDCVSHLLLLKKLKHLGITGYSLNWLESYLSNRTQYVEITQIVNNKIIKTASAIKTVKLGVPQGSILGPLLFLCYLKDMGDSLACKPSSQLCLYADDSNLMISSPTLDQIEVTAFIELENLGSDLLNRNLILNNKKTNFIKFKTVQKKDNSEPTILYNSQLIEQKTCTNFLGLTIDQHLDWNDHVSKVLTKINSGIYALSKMSYFCNLTTLKNIYHAYIHSHISFGICLFGATKKTNLDSILKLQKRAIRIMLKLKYDESAKNHFKVLNILTVYGQYILDSILISKQNEAVQTVQYSHNYNTRNKNLYDKTHYRLKFYEKKPSHAGERFLEKIPNEIKNEINPLKFKKQLKEYLTSAALYSLEEFFHLPS